MDSVNSARTLKRHRDFSEKVSLAFRIFGHNARVPGYMKPSEAVSGAHEGGHVVGVKDVSLIVSASREAAPVDLLGAARMYAEEDGKSYPVAIIERPGHDVTEAWAVLALADFLRLLDDAQSENVK